MTDKQQILALYNLKMKVSRLELLKNEIRLNLIENGVYVEKYIGKTLSDEAQAEYKRQAGILGNTLKALDMSNVNQIVNGSFHNATFSDNVWSNTSALSNHLDAFLVQSIINGKHPNDVARDVRKMFNVSRNQAERLMRTESARVQAEVMLDSYQQLGVERYEWVAEPGACHLCKPLDGKSFDLDKAEYGKNLFPIHPNCRCACVPALDEDEYEKWLEEKSEQKKAERGTIDIEIDEWTPCLRRLSDNKIIQTQTKDMTSKNIPSNKFKFNFNDDIKKGYIVKGLYADNALQGMVSFEAQSQNKAVFVHHAERILGDKKYNGVGAHLFAEEVSESFKQGFDGVVFFDTKNQKLNNYYEKTLGAEYINGFRMWINERAAKKLYDYYNQK